MPLSSLKPPGRYPLRFHTIIHLMPSVQRMGLEQATEKAALLEVRRFRYFRASLHQYPAHPTAQLYKKLVDAGWLFKVKAERLGAGYDVVITCRQREPLFSPDKRKLQALAETLGIDLKEKD